MSVLNRIVSTAKGAAARGGTSATRRPAGGRPAGRGRAASGTNPMVERGVRTAMNALKRRGR